MENIVSAAKTDVFRVRINPEIKQELESVYTPRRSCNYAGLRTGKYVSGAPRSRAEPKRLRVYA